MSNEWVAATQGVKAHPEIDSEILGIEGPDWVIRDIDPAHPSKLNESPTIPGANPVDPASEPFRAPTIVVCISVAGPPRHHARRRWNAGFLRRCFEGWRRRSRKELRTENSALVVVLILFMVLRSVCPFWTIADNGPDEREVQPEQRR